MADYYSIIKRILDKQSNCSVEFRIQVYARAKASVEQQVGSLNLPPNGDHIAAYLKQLDDAIVRLESEYSNRPKVDSFDRAGLGSSLPDGQKSSGVMPELPSFMRKNGPMIPKSGSDFADGDALVNHPVLAESLELPETSKEVLVNEKNFLSYIFPVLLGILVVAWAFMHFGSIGIHCWETIFFPMRWMRY